MEKRKIGVREIVGEVRRDRSRWEINDDKRETATRCATEYYQDMKRISVKSNFTAYGNETRI